MQQLSEVRQIINAENSDIFDVLAYIAFAMEPITRSKRVESRQSEIFSKYEDPKLQAFLEFVMGQYINEGVGEVDSSKLPDLIQLRYGAIHDGVKELGEVPIIRSSFIGFRNISMNPSK